MGARCQGEPVTELIVRSERVVLPHGVGAAAIYVREGRIVAVGGHDDVPAGVRVMDAGELPVLPGLVDSHVHINDPGRESWEGFEHATRAAAAGGVTAVIDMPLNSVPATTDVEGLDAKLRAAGGRCHVDVGFWGGVVPGNSPALQPLAERGVLGFKCFLSPSGVDEFEHVSEVHLREALPVLSQLGLPLLVHAELPSMLRDPEPGSDPHEYATWLHCRPCESEHAAIELVIRLAREFDAHVHVVHLASAGGLTALRLARAAGVRVTVETCPHYLTFAAEDMAAGATAFKCAPPIREREHRERLWKALAEGHIDLIATDHSPSPPELKHLVDGDFLRAWGGIASLQVGLAAVWTGAVQRGLPLERVAHWMSAAPARLAGLERTKGTIAPGCDADLVIWDLDVEDTVEPARLHHRHPVTPYAGMRLRGMARTTMLRGQIVCDEGRFAGAPRGLPLLARSRG